jgi:hypothetical protein
MNISPFFISHSQPSLIEQLVKCGFDYIAKFPQAAAMFRIAIGNQWCNFALLQRLANLFLRIISPFYEILMETLKVNIEFQNRLWRPNNKGPKNF